MKSIGKEPVQDPSVPGSDQRPNPYMHSRTAKQLACFAGSLCLNSRVILKTDCIFLSVHS